VLRNWWSHFIAVAIGLVIALIVTLTGTTTDLADPPRTTTTTPTTTDVGVEPGNIVDVVRGNIEFSTLVELVTAAGLAETLAGPGPFTVFAPSNEAFAKLGAATLAALRAAPKGALTDILKLHVIPGKVDSSTAIAFAGTKLETLGGTLSVAEQPAKALASPSVARSSSLLIFRHRTVSSTSSTT